MTTLSVVITAKDEAQRGLLKQLRAVLAQERACDQLIMLDDGSRDETGDLMLQVLRDHKMDNLMREPIPGWIGEDDTAHLANNSEEPTCQPRWRMLVRDQPSGINRAFNLAAHEATCDFLYLASANDHITAEAFSFFQMAIDKYPDAQIVTGNPAFMLHGWPTELSFLTPMEFTKCLHTQHIHGCSTFIRREAWLKYGGYREDLGSLADFWLYHLIALRHGIAYIPMNISVPGDHPSGHRDCHDRNIKRVISRTIAKLLDGEFSDLKHAFDTTVLGSVVWRGC